MPENSDTKPASGKWPYTSFKTILNLLQRFADNQAVPPRIDRSILGGSEGQKTQVLAALKFLALISDNGEVTPSMQKLVEQEKERPRLIRELLGQHYPAATKLARVNATTKQLEETFTGLSGDTLRKAVTFYLQASKYAGHPVSKNFKTPTGFPSRSPGSRRPRTPNASGDMSPPPPPPPAKDARARYLDMLLEKASKGDTLDPELLNRIEKLLGYANEDSSGQEKNGDSE
jgi:hypothetical protein